ncbi:hypothetical protein [Nostoc sphaeroides]|uniref:Cytochrome c domain-containing protein n=1 Tax=Nostoc sphaeroides CCNUC1 TaxID=2653204 RepID=A0A5P8VQ69_9NOSO|nr:hypothetical protein [Nostoc sphaeroides]QFS42575.1 hypothetical protein GXM_00048 [Nostoc sphaeroides CCNUC1]
MDQARLQKLIGRCLSFIFICFALLLTDPAYALVLEKSTELSPNNISQKQKIQCSIPIKDYITRFQNFDHIKYMAQYFPDTFAWDAFMLLNWPSQGKDSSTPNTSECIGNATPVIWEAWKESSEVYLDNGKKPQGWGTPRQVPAEVLAKAQDMGLRLDQPFHNIGLIQQVSGLVFKSSEDNQSKPIRYELGMNKSTFNYIFDQSLYNKNGQETAAKNCNPASKNCIQFNWDAMEIKTSWLWLNGNPRSAEIANRYVTANAYYQKTDNSGNPLGYEVGQAAMTGMHITSKALPDWVWATFENVYNAEYTPATIENPIPDQAQKANIQYQKLLQGTKYANYELVGTQINFTDPELLANSQIETHFQAKSSCITCHAIAAVSKQPTGPFYLSFVDNRDGNLTYYTGELTPELEAQMQTNFVPLDYVWSLRLAKRDRTATSP